jgi:hypothetical protein
MTINTLDLIIIVALSCGATTGCLLFLCCLCAKCCHTPQGEIIIQTNIQTNPIIQNPMHRKPEVCNDDPV